MGSHNPCIAKAGCHHCPRPISVEERICPYYNSVEGFEDEYHVLMECPPKFARSIMKIMFLSVSLFFILVPG